MRKPLAQKIRHLIEEACVTRGVPYNKAYYRRAKKALSKIPRKERHKINAIGEIN